MSGGGNAGRVFPLAGNQVPAVDPQDNVWLSASAGTGKTQVLSARVLRLLLREGVTPEQLLCLTFTKAGAAEMAVRVSAVLANWVRMPDTLLGNDLLALGASNSPDTRERARSLFAKVLDCPGGGLRIDTIHAFSQWLLAAFPQEAGLVPGTRPMEDRDRDLLAHEVLAGLLTQNDPVLTQAVEALSVRLGPDATRKWLMRCGEARDLWIGEGSWQEADIASRVRSVLGLDTDADASTFASACADSSAGVDAVRQVMWAYDQWGTASAQKYASAVGDWLLGSGEDRFTGAGALKAELFNDKGLLKYQSNLEKKVDGVAALAEDALAYLDQVAQQAALLALVDYLVPALTAGRRFALAWDEAKNREWLIDFNDQIALAAKLLASPDLGPWIRFKLDRQFDHILIDEAQDTNAAQWSIIKALTDDFFSGEGQRAGKQRTIFVVGDYKQAIFGFQGTSPDNFEAARTEFEQVIDAAADNANALRPKREARRLQTLGLGRSYRTSQPVLDFVDTAIAAIGPASFGLAGQAELHEGFDRAGQVVLWPPLLAHGGDEDDGSSADDTSDSDAQDWISEPERLMADKIAAQVRRWLDDGFTLVKDAGKPRNAGPGDIMVLVRKRRELAGLIVARLYAAGVPVAGVDRLRLGAPLVVKDLMAALRFAAQPLDDLSLANLLVSPLIGWTQDQLLARGWRPKGRALWDHLRRSDEPDAMAAAERLRDLLRRADTEPPQALLYWLLVGPWQGRRALIARLGSEAGDPIDELLNAANAYAGAHTASLAGFIRWFDSGDGELKREAGASDGLVRVMTVHGSKGLQAPIVILADATGNPDKSLPRSLTLHEGTRAVPMPPLRKDERIGPIAAADEAVKQADREEHWRLLYVAMTRAEEALFIGGALGKRETEPAADSWYARLAALPGGAERTDPVWGQAVQFGYAADPVATATPDNDAEQIDLPPWALQPVGEEPRPPRPLAPSAAGEDRGSQPPLPSAALAEAARRGALIHRLLERLPEVASDTREAQARAWLAKTAPDLPDAAREEALQSALTIIAHPDYADLFGPDALAEVPLAATVGGQVIAGVADRLLITPDCVTVVDFKTARRAPTGLDDVPDHVRRQMAAYAAVLGEIYPGCRVRAALLYTHTPLLIELPEAELARHKAALSTAQQSFDPLLLE